MARGNAAAGITAVLAEYVSSVRFRDLPPDVQDMSRYLCLDFLGVALRGAVEPSSRAVQRTVARLAGGGGSVVMGTPATASPEYAALANGTAAHAIEMDDVSNEASLHPGVAVFPTAFACAEMVAVSGEDLLAAVVAGYDVAIRLGRALNPASHYARGFHPTGTCGAFAAAAVAGRLMRQPPEVIAAALGIAGGQAAGSMEYLAEGAWTKRLNPGWAAHSGIVAALLAGEGFRGPVTIVEGRNGFLRAYSDAADPSRVLEGLGETHLITRTSVKPHACCRYSQGPIDCLIGIARAHDLRPDTVERVTIGVLSAGFGLVADPPEQKRRPRSVVDAQFSMPFGAAVALLHGRATPAEYAEEHLADPRVRDLMARVECVRDPALDAHYPARWPAWAEVATRDGRTLRAHADYPKGDPENPLTSRELTDKFHALVEPVVPHERRDELVSRVQALHQERDVRAFTRLLASPAG